MENEPAFIQARQLIYTRVETDYSFQGRSGFQTYYISKGLTGEDQKRIEDNVKSFDVDFPSYRLQFFLLPDGKAVVSHTQAVKTIPEIMDLTNRPGLFIAHCLIFTKEEFEALRQDPFWVIDHFSFVSDAVQMVQSYRPATGLEIPASIQVPDPEMQPSFPYEWAEQAGRLVQVSERYYTTKPVRPTLFYGSSAAIEEGLRALIYFTQPAKRLSCTFNSHIPASDFAHDTFAFLGSPYRSDTDADSLINSDMREIVTKQAPVRSPDPYVSWAISHTWSETDAEILLSFQELGFAFACRAKPKLARCTESGCERFFLQFAGMAKQNLEQILQKIFSSSFSPFFAKLLIDLLPSKGWLLSIAASGQPDFQAIAWVARTWIVQQPGEALSQLRKDDLSDLLKMAETAHDPILQFWMLALLKDTKRSRKVIEQMTQEPYSLVFQLADKTNSKGEPLIFPEELVHPLHRQVMVEQMAVLLTHMRDEDFIILIERMIEIGITNELGAFSNRVEVLNNKYLTRLEEILKKSPPAPTSFNAAVQSRRSRLGPAYTVINRIIGKTRG